MSGSASLKMSQRRTSAISDASARRKTLGAGFGGALFQCRASTLALEAPNAPPPAQPFARLDKLTQKHRFIPPRVNELSCSSFSLVQSPETSTWLGALLKTALKHAQLDPHDVGNRHIHPGLPTTKWRVGP